MGSPIEGTQAADPYGRQPFENAALDNVDKLNALQPHHYASPDKMSLLAKEVGLLGVVRWKPRLVPLYPLPSPPLPSPPPGL